MIPLCSRNARAQNVLVRRPQWDQHGYQSQGEKAARSGGQSRPPPKDDVRKVQERAGGSPQPTTSLPGESEQYPIAAMSRQQDEVHTLRLAGN